MKYLKILIPGLLLVLGILVSCTVNSTNPTSYALIIGINDYVNLDSTQDLSYCVNDANGIRDALVNNGWDEKNITLLTDESGTQNASKQNILTSLSTIVENATANDLILVYYSGHGTQLPDDNGDETDGYDECIVPVDFDPNDYSTLIRDDEIGEIFSASKTQKGVFIFDSCNSGGLINKGLSDYGFKKRTIDLAGAAGTKALTTNPASDDLDIYEIPVLTASSQDEYSWESPALGHGVFTYYLIRGIAEKEADYNSDGYITVREIFKYAETNTEYYVAQTTGYEQNPEIQAPQFFTDILITH